MRLLLIIMSLGVLLASCGTEGEVAVPLYCQDVVTYIGIDECYQVPTFVVDNGMYISPMNLDQFMEESDLKLDSEYQLGYNPVNDEITQSGSCNENAFVQAVKFNCIKEL